MKISCVHFGFGACAALMVVVSSGHRVVYGQPQSLFEDVLQLGERNSSFRSGGWITQDHAATPKSVWMNWRCPTTSPLGSQRICPLRIRCIAS